MSSRLSLFEYFSFLEAIIVCYKGIDFSVKNHLLHQTRKSEVHLCGQLA